MRKEMINKSVSVFFAIVFLLSVIFNGIPNQSVSAAATYNRDAAVNWANSNNRDDGSRGGEKEGRWCTTYVTKAMQAGGIDIGVINANNELATWLRAHTDIWEIKPKDQLIKGDILFRSNTKDIPDNLNVDWIDHVVLVTAPGIMSMWNAERMNKKFSWATYTYEKGIHFKDLVPSTIPTVPPVEVKIPTQFLGNPSSTLRDNNGSADLKVCADNIIGQTVYVVFSRPGKTWSYNKKATSRCVSFTNMDGSGPLNGNTLYESRAALNQQPSPSWSSRSCYAGNSNQQGLCDTVRKNNK
jgi:hypothetical protein